MQYALEAKTREKNLSSASCGRGNRKCDDGLSGVYGILLHFAADVQFNREETHKTTMAMTISST